MSPLDLIFVSSFWKVLLFMTAPLLIMMALDIILLYKLYVYSNDEEYDGFDNEEEN